MQETLNYILDNYLRAKKDPFKENTVANFLRKNVSENIRNKTLLDSSKYIVEGSPGKGTWADVPWIGIFDKDITDTATKGYDIVYLFCADMSGVYISLNQGWTYFKNKYGTKVGRKKIRTVSNAWKSILSSTLTDFSFEAIQLKGISKNSDLAEGYELGHICGKFYEAGKIPNDLKLIEDLRNLMGVYRELRGKLKENSIEKTNNYLIVNYDLGLLNEENDENILDDIEDSIEELQKSAVLVEEKPPLNFSSKENDTNDFRGRHTDFLGKARTLKKLGFAGELMVINYEKQNLTANGKENLALDVKHVSKEEGDGTGYDILSYEVDGTKKYIEVKTTTGKKTTPFMITANELKFSEINSSNYFLYRVFDFDKKNQTGKLFIMKGDISEILYLKPQQFVASGIKNSEHSSD